MSLINDALKKAQRDRETAGNGDPAQQTPEAVAPQPPAPRVGPRPGNPAATRTFRWTRRIVGVTLAAAGTTAAVLFLLVLIRPTPEPEFVPPREMAVHIKVPHPTATESPADDTAASTSPTGSNAVPAATPSTTAPADTRTAPTQPAEAPAANPAPAQEPAIAFKLQAEEGTTSTTDAQPPAGLTTEPNPAPANTVATTPAPAKDTTPAPATATPPSTPDAAPMAAASEPASTAPAATPAPAQEGPLPIAFAMPDQPVTVAATETAEADEEQAEMSSPGAEGDPAVLAFLNASRIAGVKVAGRQSRVLMNNQVFFVGSVVDPNTRLRIKAIENSEIEFIDESGLEYRKRFQR